MRIFTDSAFKDYQAQIKANFEDMKVRYQNEIEGLKNHLKHKERENERSCDNLNSEIKRLQNVINSANERFSDMELSYARQNSAYRHERDAAIGLLTMHENSNAILASVVTSLKLKKGA